MARAVGRGGKNETEVNSWIWRRASDGLSIPSFSGVICIARDGGYVEDIYLVRWDCIVLSVDFK